MKVVVGSNNPVKVAAVREAFSAVFPTRDFTYESCSAASNVSEQPIGSKETRAGAYNRAEDCKLMCPEADFWVGLEGGIEKEENQYWVIAWMCVMSPTKIGYGKAGAFALPNQITTLLEQGTELGHATDSVFKEVNSKHRSSTVGLLTDDVITRTDYYREALVYALIPFNKPELYSE